MADQALDRDEAKLAELGYKQELTRGWSRFSNFAISFTIISVLAGCFTTYPQAWNLGGPIAISWGWPIVCIIVLAVAFSMAEVASAYPTAGGPYWWANELGGPVWSWYTGWLNLLGLIAIVATVDWFCAQFFSFVFNLWGLDLGIINFADAVSLEEIFALFVVILALHAMINIFSSHLVALFNNISVFWHCVGVLVIIGILIIVPDNHQSADFVFTERINNSGFDMSMYWWYILPTGLLLTMYTVTGYDASAHVAEETRDAEISAAKGVWQSVALSALIGWFVLLAITFAASDVGAVNDGGGTTLAIFQSAMSEGWAETVILISAIGQFFCGMACVTSCSRTFFALSRDRMTPGHRLWASVNGARGVPVAAVIGSCVLAGILTLPALSGNAAGVPVAFFAVVSIGVLGLLLRIRDPGVPALARRHQLQAGRVEPGQQVEVAQPDRRRVGDPHLDLLLPAVLRAGGGVVGRLVRLERGELHAARHGRAPDRHHHRVVRRDEQALQGPDPHDRVRRGHRHQADRRAGRAAAAAPPPAAPA